MINDLYQVCDDLRALRWQQAQILAGSAEGNADDLEAIRAKAESLAQDAIAILATVNNPQQALEACRVAAPLVPLLVQCALAAAEGA